MSFFVSYNIILKSILSEIRIAIPPFFWFPFTWIIFFLHFTCNLYVSLDLKWVSCRQHICGPCFCIHSVNLYLLVGAFNLFTFKVIIDLYVLIGIFLIVLYLFFVGLSFLSCLLAMQVPLVFIVRLVQGR